jgi:20S proteasome alpha/beta subunit
VQYQFAHDRPLDVGATAQLLSNTLYYKRFFPYYTANLCVGLDPQGATLAQDGGFALYRLLSLLQALLPMSCRSRLHLMRLRNEPCVTGLQHRLCVGRGAVYTYDGIGSYERTGYSCEVPISHPACPLARSSDPSRLTLDVHGVSVRRRG